jgi:hypothetical protein
MERRRGGFNQRWKLPEDALLDGIHAKLQNGELVVVIPKRTEQVLAHAFWRMPLLDSSAALCLPTCISFLGTCSYWQGWLMRTVLTVVRRCC